MLGQQRFVEQPEDASAIKGTTVVLHCRIENVIGTVQWTKGGFGLGSERNLPDYGRYEFVGSISLGKISTDNFFFF